MAPKIIDLTGKRIGRLLVLRRHSPIVPQKPKWVCLCDCGTKVVIDGGDLRRKDRAPTRSCGCLIREATSRRTKGKPGHHRTHGQSHRSPAYGSWAHARERCRNRGNAAWERYGGRGIKFCKRWDDFGLFLKDMGPRPPGTSLDRYPNPDGNYEPGNCRWATRIERARNRGT